VDRSFVAPGDDISRVQQKAMIVGAVFTIALIVGAIFTGKQFFHSYLYAFLFWTGISVGSLGLLMLQYLTGGAWGIVIRRILESSTRTIPLMALLFIPVLLGIHHIYEWSHPAESHHSQIIEMKSRYLNVPGFVTRGIIYFLIWLVLAYFLNRWSNDLDRTRDHKTLGRLKAISGPGFLLYTFVVTFASVDWIMSLEPEWYSTIFGLLLMGGWGLAGLSFTLLVLYFLYKRAPFRETLNHHHFNDYGRLLLALVMLWAYLSFSQFLIIWSANLPEEIGWYLKRLKGPYGYIALSLVLVHFALPFLLLLSRDVKRHGRRLSTVATIVLVMHLVYLYWIVSPAISHGHFHLHWMDLLAALAIGGVWLTLFLSQLKKRPLIPADPDLHKVFEHKGH
jgi:hypothetical protein